MSSYKRFTILLLSSILGCSENTLEFQDPVVPIINDTVMVAILDTIQDTVVSQTTLEQNIDSTLKTFKESEKQILKLDSVVKLKCKYKQRTNENMD